MRTEIESNPAQKFPDRLGGNHPSVLYSAEERRAIIAGIAEDCYRAMGYPMRPEERKPTIRLWCEQFESIPDTSLEYVREAGLKNSARTPQEYVAIYDRRVSRELKHRATVMALDAIEIEKATAVPSGQLSPGKEYAFSTWEKVGILRP